MTLGSIRELIKAVQPRYMRAAKAEKLVILDEFCKVTGYHRKSAIRCLTRDDSKRRTGTGRPKVYGSDLVPALRVAWEAADRICSKRLAPFMAELVPILERHHELELSDAMRAQLVAMSASTMERLLAPLRRRLPGRRPTTTQSVTALKALIPIRTCAERKTSEVGHIEADLAAHCGTSSEGFYLNTLVAVDLASGWTECAPVWGKGQTRVGSAMDRARRQFPFPVVGLSTDNGSEFINRGLWDYCKRNHIEFTRSRAYKKNDQAHVEQKNWSVVRRYIGYDRYDSKAAYQHLEYLYSLVRLYINFFQPVRKVVGVRREDGRAHKQFDTAQTPYQRLLRTAILDPKRQQSLADLYACLNPVPLRKQIDEALHDLWMLALPDSRTDKEAAALAEMDASTEESLGNTTFEAQLTDGNR